ncbi:MAG: hypothetical protein AAF408_10920 [Pseudomonadota bacterium]
MIRKLHPVAGVIGILMIFMFWISTLLSELLGSYETIARVKGLILYGMIILVPAMAIVGATGMSLGQRRKDAPALAKKKRMPIIAANGLLVLMPAAFFLASKANAGSFDSAFFTVQIVELFAGAANLFLMGLSIRDGRRMTRRRRHGRTSGNN